MAADPFPPPGDTGFMQWVIGVLGAAVVALFGWLMKTQNDRIKDKDQATRELIENTRAVDKATDTLKHAISIIERKSSKE